MINHKFALKNVFQEILYRIDNWSNEGCRWIVESIESQYINISTYRPLSVNSYMDLPVELRNPRKGLINIKNKDQKCFLWCHVRQVNAVQVHPELHRMTKSLLIILIMMGLNFLCEKKILARLKKEQYLHKLPFPIAASDQKFENSMDLLLVTDGDKSHYV